MGKFKKDLEKYKAYSGKSSFVLLLTQQGLWAIYVYRMSNRIYRSRLPGLFKKPLLLMAVLWQKWIEVVAGISIPYTVSIGERFYLGHFGNIIINANVIIGDNCNISQGVTLGISGRGEKRGVPVIGNNVYIGVNSVVAGKINVADNTVIGANSLVVKTIKEGATYLGVPAQRVSDNTSKDYI